MKANINIRIKANKIDSVLIVFLFMKLTIFALPKEEKQKNPRSANSTVSNKAFL